MDTPILHTNLTKTLGIDQLSIDEQSAFLAEIGDVILETSLTRLVSVMSEQQHQALMEYLETDPEPDVLLGHLIQHYEQFRTILEETVLEFKEDALKVLDQEKDVAVADHSPEK